MIIDFRIAPGELAKIDHFIQVVEKKIRKSGEASVDEVGRAMRSYAKRVAPKDTKRLMRLIKYYKKGDKPHGELVSQNPTGSNAPAGYQGKRKKDFNLAYWFANSPRAVRHAKHGYARYMDMAEKFGNKIFKGIVDREIDKRFK